MGLWGFPMHPPALPPRTSPRSHSKAVHTGTNQAIPEGWDLGDMAEGEQKPAFPTSGTSEILQPCQEPPRWDPQEGPVSFPH